VLFLLIVGAILLSESLPVRSFSPL
jgi:hypothetical protein